MPDSNAPRTGNIDAALAAAQAVNARMAEADALAARLAVTTRQVGAADNARAAPAGRTADAAAREAASKRASAATANEQLAATRQQLSMEEQLVAVNRQLGAARSSLVRGQGAGAGADVVVQREQRVNQLYQERARLADQIATRRNAGNVQLGIPAAAPGGREQLSMFPGSYGGGGGLPPIIPPAPPGGGGGAGEDPAEIERRAKLLSTARSSVMAEGQATRETSAAVQLLSANMAGLDNTMTRHGVMASEAINAAARGELTYREWGQQIAGTAAKFAGWTAVSIPIFGVIGVMSKLYSGTVGGAAGVEQLRRSLGSAGVDANRAFEGFDKVSRDVNVSVKEVADAQFYAARAFRDQGESLKVASTALQAYKLDQIQAQDAVRAFSTLHTQFGTSAAGVSDVFNRLDVGQQRFNARMQDTLPALQRAAPAARGAGGNLQQLVDIVIAATRASGQSGSIVGTALARAPAMLGHASSQATLRELGFDPKEPQQNFTQFIIDAVRRASTMTNQQKIDLSGAMGGGARGLQVWMGMMNQPNLLLSQVPAATRHAEGSAAEDLAHKLKQVDEQISHMGNSVERFGMQLGRNATPLALLLRLFNDLLDSADRLVGAFNGLPEAMRQIISTVGMFAGVVAGARALNVGRAFGGPGGGFFGSALSRSPVDQAAKEVQAQAREDVTNQLASVRRTGQRAYNQGIIAQRTGIGFDRFQNELLGPAGPDGKRLRTADQLSEMDQARLTAARLEYDAKVRLATEAQLQLALEQQGLTIASERRAVLTDMASKGAGSAAIVDRARAYGMYAPILGERPTDVPPHRIGVDEEPTPTGASSSTPVGSSTARAQERLAAASTMTAVAVTRLGVASGAAALASDAQAAGSFRAQVRSERDVMSTMGLPRWFTGPSAMGRAMDERLPGRDVRDAASLIGLPGPVATPGAIGDAVAARLPGRNVRDAAESMGMPGMLALPGAMRDEAGAATGRLAARLPGLMMRGMMTYMMGDMMAQIAGGAIGKVSPHAGRLVTSVGTNVAMGAALGAMVPQIGPLGGAGLALAITEATRVMDHFKSQLTEAASFGDVPGTEADWQAQVKRAQARLRHPVASNIDNANAQAIANMNELQMRTQQQVQRSNLTPGGGYALNKAVPFRGTAQIVADARDFAARAKTAKDLSKGMDFYLAEAAKSQEYLAGNTQAVDNAKKAINALLTSAKSADPKTWMQAFKAASAPDQQAMATLVTDQLGRTGPTPKEMDKALSAAAYEQKWARQHPNDPNVAPNANMAKMLVQAVIQTTTQGLQDSITVATSPQEIQQAYTDAMRNARKISRVSPHQGAILQATIRSQRADQQNQLEQAQVGATNAFDPNPQNVAVRAVRAAGDAVRRAIEVHHRGSKEVLDAMVQQGQAYQQLLQADLADLQAQAEYRGSLGQMDATLTGLRQQAQRIIGDAHLSPAAKRQQLLPIQTQINTQVEQEYQSALTAHADLIASMHNDPVEAARAQAAAAQQRLAHGHFATPADRMTAQATANRAYQGVQQAQYDNLQTTMQLNQLSTSQEVAALTRFEHQIRNNKQLKDQVRLQILNLQHQNAGDFELNVGNVKLPSLYDVRRQIAQNTGGTIQPMVVNNNMAFQVDGSAGAQEVAHVVSRHIEQHTTRSLRTARRIAQR